MEKWMVVLPIFMALLAQTASKTFKDMEVLLIDSGAEDWWDKHYNGFEWNNDEHFISTGKNKLLEPTIPLPGYMWTLRYFPKGLKNCYTLPLSNQFKFLIRAGFYYGNYDKLSKPPTFDLRLGGEFWATVNTSLSDQEPIYHEVIYAPKGEKIEVCLVQTRDGEIPFISSLEAAYLESSQPVYNLMGNNTALHLVSRVHFGDSDNVIWPSLGSESLLECQESLYRFWNKKPMPGYMNISLDQREYCPGIYIENVPPEDVMRAAISPPTASDSIFIPFNLTSNTPQIAYFVFYFVDYEYLWNGTDNRKFEIYIDNAWKGSMEIGRDGIGHVVTLYPVSVNGSTNVRISAAIDSVLPPILNGMEVFTATEMFEQPNGGFQIHSSYKFLFCVVFSVFVLFFEPI